MPPNVYGKRQTHYGLWYVITFSNLIELRTNNSIEILFLYNIYKIDNRDRVRERVSE